MPILIKAHINTHVHQVHSFRYTLTQTCNANSDRCIVTSICTCTLCQSATHKQNISSYEALTWQIQFVHMWTDVCRSYELSVCTVRLCQQIQYDCGYLVLCWQRAAADTLGITCRVCVQLKEHTLKASMSACWSVSHFCLCFPSLVSFVREWRQWQRGGCWCNILYVKCFFFSSWTPSIPFFLFFVPTKNSPNWDMRRELTRGTASFYLS